MCEHQIIVNEDGTLEVIYSDDLTNLLAEGSTVTQRASHVEPGLDGWYADMALSGGEVLGPFTLRADALAEEVRWLKRKMAA
jgi:hypothetical protein